MGRWFRAFVCLSSIAMGSTAFPSSSSSSSSRSSIGVARRRVRWPFSLSNNYNTQATTSRRPLRPILAVSHVNHQQHQHRHDEKAHTRKRAMEQLCCAWNISSSESTLRVLPVQASFERCPELVEAVLQFGSGEDNATSSLATWLADRGRIRVERLSSMVQRHPLLLARALKSPHVKTVQQILEGEIGLSQAQWDRMCRQKGAFPHRWTRSHVRRLLHLLRHRPLFLTDFQTQKILSTRPQIVLYPIEKWEELLLYLERDLSLSQDEISRMIRLAPMLVSYSISQQYQPTMEFLRTLGSLERIRRRVVSKYPQVLMHSVDGVLRPKLQFLAERLQLARARDASEIVLKFPPVFWLRPELLDSKITFLESELELTVVELSYLIGSYPQVLGLSVEHNLQPTMVYLRESLTLDQLREFVLYQPSLLAYSLESRLRPRLELLKFNDIAFAYSPPYLMSLTDAKFQAWIEMNVATWSISGIP